MHLVVATLVDDDVDGDVGAIVGFHLEQIQLNMLYLWVIVHQICTHSGRNMVETVRNQQKGLLHDKEDGLDTNTLGEKLFGTGFHIWFGRDILT
jgi:hypothetical protein